MSYTYLRTDKPHCPNGHELGTWVKCSNEKESHVFLKRDNSGDGRCPHCQSPTAAEIREGMMVKCLHTTDAGLGCITRPYVWIKEGPPCFMNHIDKMKVEA